MGSPLSHCISHFAAKRQLCPSVPQLCSTVVLLTVSATLPTPAQNGHSPTSILVPRPFRRILLLKNSTTTTTMTKTYISAILVPFTTSLVYDHEDRDNTRR